MEVDEGEREATAELMRKEEQFMTRMIGRSFRTLA